MKKNLLFIGLDVHAKTITIAVAHGEGGDGGTRDGLIISSVLETVKGAGENVVPTTRRQCGADDPSAWRDGRRWLDGSVRLPHHARVHASAARRYPAPGGGQPRTIPPPSPILPCPTSRRLHIADGGTRDGLIGTRDDRNKGRADYFFCKPGIRVSTRTWQASTHAARRPKRAQAALLETRPPKQTAKRSRVPATRVGDFTAGLSNQCYL